MRTAARWMAVALLAAAGPIASLQAQDWSKVQIQTVKLTDNIYLLAGDGGNIALLVGEDRAMLVDSGFAELSEKLAA